MKIRIFISILAIVFFCHLTGAQENITFNATESPSVISIASPNETTINEAKFRVGPTVRLRPLNSIIEKDKDGIIELFMNNPSLNDITLEVDLSVSVPSGIYIYGADGGISGGAGTVVGHFSVPPGSSRTITLYIKGSEIGDFPVHFSGMYWPDGDKDKWNPISLDNSFKVLESSNDLDDDGIYRPFDNYYEFKPSQNSYIVVIDFIKEKKSNLQTIGILSSILFFIIMLVYGPGGGERKEKITNRMNLFKIKQKK